MPGHHIMTGRVWHRRHEPVVHEFSYDMHMLLVDLDDLDGLYGVSPLLGRRARPLTLRARDFVDDSDRPLAEKVRRKAAALGLDFSDGRLLMLAQPRGLGWQFNPLVLYWHFPAGAGRPQGVLAEVRNTPWHERHWYALSAPEGEALTFFRHEKAFHVSPFMAMDMEYQWELAWEEPLKVRLNASRRGKTLFEAGLRLASQPLDRPGLARKLPGLVLQGLRTSLGIYRQALRLWRKKAPFHRHPSSDIGKR